MAFTYPLSHVSRTHDHDMLASYWETRRVTEALCAPLHMEDYVIQSMPDVSPPKWHLAHTSWFFETFILQAHLPGYTLFHPRYGYLFNSYYETVGQFHPRQNRGLMSRPDVEEIYRYRAHVDQALESLLESADDARLAEIMPLLRLGIHHEQQHQELLLMDILHIFASNLLRPAYITPQDKETTLHGCKLEPLRFQSVQGGLVSIGHDGDGFAFDNEMPRHTIHLQDYALASRLVTNGEYRAFMEDGGYERPEFWLSDGWKTVQTQSWQAPLYWERSGQDWWTMSLTGMRAVDNDEAVSHISYYEADAYARWAGKRLPREGEWEQAAQDQPLDGNLLESARFHPVVPARTDRLAQLFGDLWEWTQSPYMPYPGFHAPTGALGEYNGKFMCNQMVLRGGSCLTPRVHIRPSYRNFFPPDARWQFAGLRLAEDL